MTAINPESSPAAMAAEAELRRLAEAFHLPLLTVVADEMLDPELVARLPLDWARGHTALPVRYAEGLGVLLADPLNLDVPKHLSLLFNCELTPLLAPPAVILAAIEKCYFQRPGTPADFLAELSPPTVAAAPRADDLLQTSAHAPVSQLVNLILLGAVKAGASDVHLEPFESRLRVRYRVDGLLYEQASPPKHLEAALVSRLKVMAHMDISEKRLPQDGAARVRVGERELDVRVSTIPAAEGERVVLRLLNRAETLRPMDGLGMPPELLKEFQVLLRETSGMLLVCGPTGSGKTTTLYAALQQLDRAHTNILTIEDPIEYQLDEIGQMQVKPKIGLDFAEGLRHILRQDPDTIMVGEIRDAATAEIAVRASLTGHLVFSTLHTNDAAGAVLRMLDVGVEPYLLAAALRAALAQRLARRLCPACCRPAELTPADLVWLEDAGIAPAGAPALQGAGPGCPDCLEGYRGRVGLFELLAMRPALAALVRAGSCDAAELRAAAGSEGLRSLGQDGWGKACAGLTSMEELRRAIGRVG
ncbi:MAG: GspE/PulE family protein [Kiritimatiellia bacterium]|nr:Flp pilus assembly complex ATPase component TadA [Lentisphaerota bacterium]